MPLAGRMGGVVRVGWWRRPHAHPVLCAVAGGGQVGVYDVDELAYAVDGGGLDGDGGVVVGCVDDDVVELQAVERVGVGGDVWDASEENDEEGGAEECGEHGWCEQQGHRGTRNEEKKGGHRTVLTKF